MKASAAIPHLYPPVQINGSKYIDGGVSDPLPLEKALFDGHEEVVAVYNKPSGFLSGTIFDRAENAIFSRLYPRLREELFNFYKILEKKEQLISSDERIKIIRPKEKIPIRSILDTNKERINATVDLGSSDARKFLEDYLD